MRLFTPSLSRQARLDFLKEIAHMDFTVVVDTHHGHSIKKCVLNWDELTLILAFYAFLRHTGSYVEADELREKLKGISQSVCPKGPQFKKREDGEIIDYWMEETMCMGESSGFGQRLFHIQHRRDPGSTFEYET